MAGGRPPKPTATHQAKGTYRADRHGVGRASADAGIPTCPAWLAGEHRKAWNVIVEQAQHVHGLVTLADATALETCAIALSRFWQARRAVDRLKLATIVDASHGPRARPELEIERQAEVRLTAALGRFGLSPQSRAAMRLPEGGGEDPFDQLAKDLAALAAVARGDDVDETPAPAKKPASAKATAAKRKAKRSAAKPKTPSTNTTAKTAAKRTRGASSS